MKAGGQRLLTIRSHSWSWKGFGQAYGIRSCCALQVMMMIYPGNLQAVAGWDGCIIHQVISRVPINVLNFKSVHFNSIPTTKKQSDQSPASTNSSKIHPSSDSVIQMLWFTTLLYQFLQNRYSYKIKMVCNMFLSSGPSIFLLPRDCPQKNHVRSL